MTRDDAIAELGRHGLEARKRDWALGETIVVTRRDLAGDQGGIRVYKAMFYLRYEGDLFVLTDFSAGPIAAERRCGTLQEAIVAVDALFDRVAGKAE